MKTRFNIAVRVGFGDVNCVRSVSDYLSLQDTAFNFGLVREKEELNPSMKDSFNALGEFASQEFEEFLNALKKLGYRPKFGSELEVAEGEFFVGLENIYTQDDLDAAEYLYIYGFSHTWLSGDGCEGGVWRVKAASFNKREPHKYAQVWGGGIPIVGPKLKANLERERFVGLELPRVKWVPEGKCPAELWQVHSSIMMPPCRTRIFDDGGVTYFKEENGAKRARLDFAKEAVAALGKFDIAVIQEKVGPYSGEQYADSPKYVISQRFRTALITGGVKEAGYGVVRLV